MYKPGKATLAIFTSTLLVFSGCDLKTMLKKAKQQKLVVNPSPLELHGDSVRFTFSGELPVKMLKKGKQYAVALAYKYRDQKLPIGEVRFTDKDFPNQKKEAPKLSKKFSFAYKGADMDLGDLTIQGSATNLNKTKSSPEANFAKGLILTSQLVQDAYFVAYAPHGYDPRPEYYPQKVNFFFDQGSPKMRAKEIKGSSGKFLDAYIASKNATKTVTITGMHSPEGREVKNTQLSELRAKAIEKYYRAKMKGFNYGKKADSIEFISKSLIQNWVPFKDTIAVDTNLSQEEKDQVLAVVNGPGTFTEQEAKLEELPCFKTLFLKIYPKLRLGQTEILTLKPKKSEAQISLLAKAIAEGRPAGDTLSDKELAFAATMTPILEEKEGIFLAATKKNDSWASHNNLGAVRLEIAKKLTGKARQEMVNKALVNLEISKTKMENGEAYANLATAYLMAGDVIKAEDAFAKAQSLTSNSEVKRILNSVKGIIEIRKGTYLQAINSLNNGMDDAIISFDKGLAQLLNKDFSASINSFEEANQSNPNMSVNHYAIAIANARMNRETEMVAALKKAFSLDSNLKQKALNDLEFANFQNNPAFKDAIK